MTDLKAAAEAAKDRTFDFEAIRAAAEVQPSVNVDSKLLLALYAERDEARNSASAQIRHEAIDLMHTATEALSSMTARAEAAEASLASSTKEVERLREALERLAELTPSRANARDARDLHLTVKAIAETALTKEPPNAD